MKSVSPYIVSTTRAGREDSGTHQYLPIPKQQLARLIQRAMELDDCTGHTVSGDSSLPQLGKPPASPFDDSIGHTVLGDSSLRQLGKRLASPTTLLGQQRKKNRSHLRRKRKKRQEIDDKRRQTVARSEAPLVSQLSYKPQTIKVQSTGYCGLTREEPYLQMDLAGYRNAGYTIQSWDGIEPLPLTDDCGTVYAVFAGRPRSEDYLASCYRVFQALENMSDDLEFLPKQVNHRRGKYPSADFGITADQGQQEPINLYVPPNISEHAGRITNSMEMERIINFCDSSFQKWGPCLYAYYRETMNHLSSHLKYRHLEKPGSDTVFSSMSHNYGRSVVTVPHRDYKNLAFGWCAIVALGDFDGQSGGHLVLHEPRLVVEFPPGSAALIPLAVLTHSNVPIGPNDRRASVTFYSSGSLFRFVENDFQTLTTLKSHDIEKYARRQEEMKGNTGKGRWEMGLELYSTLEQLKNNVFADLSE